MLLVFLVCALSLAIPAFGAVGVGYAPTYTSSTLSSPTGNVYAGGTVTFTLHFNESVHVLSTQNLTLNSGGVATYVAGDGTPDVNYTYTVGADDANTNGDQLGFIAPFLNVTDTSSTHLLTNFSLWATDELDVAVVIIPTITGVSAPGYFGTGVVVSFSVSFTSTVNLTGTGTPSITLLKEDGSTSAATYTGGSGTAVWKFAYTVVAGEYSSVVAVSAINLNGRSAIDTYYLEPADLTITDPLESTGTVLDGVYPNVTSVTAYNIQQRILIIVSFDESVVVVKNPILNLKNPAGVQATVFGGDVSNQVVFSFVLSEGDNGTLNLDANALSFAAGSITDLAGNEADKTLKGISISGVPVVGPAPPAPEVVPPPNPDDYDFLVTITYQEKLVCNDPLLSEDEDVMNTIVADEFANLAPEDIVANHTCFAAHTREQQVYLSDIVATFAFYNTDGSDIDIAYNSTDDIISKIHANLSNVQVISVSVTSDGHAFMPTLFGMAILLFSLLMLN